MATIMTLGNSEGTRRCDSSCHGAGGPICRCICAGRYHGIASSDGHLPSNIEEAESSANSWIPRTTLVQVAFKRDFAFIVGGPEA